MKSDRQDLSPPEIIGTIPTGGSRRLVVSLLHNPHRILIRVGSERDVAGEWTPARNCIVTPGQVEELLNLLKLARERALRPTPALARKE